MRRILLSASLVAGSVAVVVLLFELVLRAVGFSAPLWYRPDPVLGWTLRPGVAGWFETEGHAYVRINSQGLRDREHSIAKPNDVYRIAVLGDSVSEAMQVDVKDTYWSLLPDRLSQCGYAPGKRIEVINFGVSGYGTAQEYLMLSAAMPYRPDLVLLQFMDGNDLTDNSRALNSEKARPYFTLDDQSHLVLDDSFARGGQFRDRSSALMQDARRIADRSRVLQLVRAAFNAVSLIPHANASSDGLVTGGINPAVLAPPRTSTWSKAWAVTERLILAMDRRLKRRGVAFAVVAAPLGVQANPDPAARKAMAQRLGVPDLFYPDRRLEALGREHGIAVIPLAFEMQRRAEADKAYYYGFADGHLGTGHWNKMGHRVAADLIASALCTGRGATPSAQARTAEPP